MPEYEVLPVQVSCGSQEFKNSLKGNGKRIKCKPRNTIVDIKSKGAQKITPSKINTRLCSGVCQGNKSCISTQSKNITVAISIVDRFNQGQCSNVMVPADTKCKCGCEMKGSDCLSTQVFDKKFCKCKCTNEVDMNNCLNKMHNSINKYEWNNKSCICQCKLESICSTGTTWDKNECKCTRVK